MTDDLDNLTPSENTNPAFEVTKTYGHDKSVEPLQLGKRVRQIRLSQNLTLEEASKLTGLARSTLSKIENEQISPTFSAVSKLVKGLGIDMPQLFTQPQSASGATGRRDITKAGEGKPHPTTTYEHELLANKLSTKKMLPYKTTVRARNFSEFGDWVRHEGEELLYVIEGDIIFYTEFYEPIQLTTGDSAYYDCEMGHAVISTSPKDAVILWVTA
ncbi:XRE family transcriptional regulator [Neptunomonas phycophila]|uniref:XRE family transcriptional regulator n=2 Tax=Gammaproteobacteria TaxID=1236 RepID=A0AAW7XPK6_9GAMM|nr:XRE family transcriptional regulator [Neptunomonas phycophila]MBT3146402.1 XRE family transcriptional regulator [Neptunomonas phycophila]MDO6454725.1 XRE family transcriptional regulator [Neptunomonas phycophila]MDO6469125.1 XRE family transcriptional regulator [Neptunomonas phycophila]MDO6785147.1 XRE family transcriptional regulator [Neptunomonas phycophila]